MTANLDLLAEYKDAINAATVATFRELPATLGVALSERSLDALQKLSEYSLRPGKRIRGSLAAAAYDQANGSHLGVSGVQLGVALELMQNYLLIVDDVMDKSALRRGEPTVHELYLQDKRLDLHEAQMMAVNVGLLAQHFAALVVARIDEPAPRVAQATQLLQVNIALTGFGQVDDLYQQPGRDVSAEDIMRKYRLKSSYYTFINPLQCGLALAGKADSAALEACRAFGLPAGVAFQLHDDMLGIFTDADELGKPNLDDVREGKYTLLMHYALEHAAAEDTAALRTILGNPAASTEDLVTVRDILERSGAKQFVKAEAEQYGEAAQTVARESTIWQPDFQEFLRQLVAFSIERLK